MDALDKMIAERTAELAKEALETCSKETAAKEYGFLKGWSRKGVLCKQSNYSTFWLKKGSNMMTKLAPAVVNGLVAHGFATLSNHGYTLTLIKGVK